MKPITFALAASTLVACLAGPDTTEPGAEQPTDDEVATPDFTREAPCGANTLAVIPQGDASIVFCDDGTNEIVGEMAALGSPSPIRALGFTDPSTACASDIFAAAAPGRAVPPILTERCVAREALGISRKRNEAPAPTPVEETDVAASYCGTTGAANFQAQCNFINDERWATSSYWCIKDLWGAHDRAMSWQMGGEEGDFADEIVASCNGNTRFRAYWREGTGDSWILAADFTVSSGYYGRWYIHPLDQFADQDFRFRGNSSAGAGHRHTGTFVDS